MSCPVLDIPASTTIHSIAVTQLIMSAYILIVQLLFKKSHAVFGKLYIFYNLGLVCKCCCHPYALLDNSKFTNNMPHYYGNICISTCRLGQRYWVIWLTSRIAVVTWSQKFLITILLRYICCYPTHSSFLCYSWRTGNNLSKLNGHYVHILFLQYSIVYSLHYQHQQVSLNNNVFRLSSLLLQVQYECLCCRKLSIIQLRHSQDCHCYGSHRWSSLLPCYYIYCCYSI